MRIFIRSSVSFIAIVVVILSPSLVFGQVTKTWSATGQGTTKSWHTANNWTPAGVPAAGDIVVIPGTANLANVGISTANAVCRDLAITGKTLTVSAPRVLTIGTTGNPGTMQINTGSTVTINGSLQVTNTVTNNAILINGGLIEFFANVTNSSTGVISNTGSGVLNLISGYQVINDGLIQNASQINLYGPLTNNALLNNNTGGQLTSTGLLANNHFFHNYTGAVLTLFDLTLGSGSQFLDEGTFSASNVITAKRDISAGQWHYISSPVTTAASFDGFLTFSSGDYFYRWQEDFYGASNPVWFPSAWVDIINGADPNGIPVDRFGTETFNKAEGYAIFKASPYIISMNGSLTRNNESFSMKYTLPVPPPTTEDYQEGWNFVGNPFPCALAANSATAHADYLLNTANLSNLHTSYQAIYLYNTNSYITVSNASAANYVSPFQGFMVRASVAAPFLFNAAMRNLNTTTFYKNENADFTQRIHLNLSGPQGDNENIVLAFIEGMTYGLDPGYDAGILKANPNLSFYSRLVEDNGIDFAIQALPIDISDLSVPLGIDAGVAGEYHYHELMLENIPDSVRIRLEDLVEGTSVDIMTEGYTFTIEEPGTIDGRFRLNFYYTAVGMNEPQATAELSTFAANGQLTVISLDAMVKIHHITLVNALGQVLSEHSFENRERVQMDIPVKNQMVLVRVATTRGTFIKKVFSR